MKAIEDFHQKDFRTDEQKEADKELVAGVLARSFSKSEVADGVFGAS